MGIEQLTTEQEVRDSFWEYYQDSYGANRYVEGKEQNEYSAGVRMAFVDYVDYLQRQGTISEELAQEVTL